MLEHQKLILRNVQDDIQLFRKELYKTLRWISDSELDDLRKWLYKNFSEKHLPVIEEVFSEEAA